MGIHLDPITAVVCSSAGCVELLKEEMQQVQSLLTPLGVSSDQLEEVYGVLRKAHCSTASMQASTCIMHRRGLHTLCFVSLLGHRLYLIGLAKVEHSVL